MNDPDFELDRLRAAIQWLVTWSEDYGEGSDDRGPLVKAYRDILRAMLDGSFWHGMDEKKIIEFMERYT